ncbi:MAG: VWA domain-containing protein, partial [Desulfobacteraceae bacterium]
MKAKTIIFFTIALFPFFFTNLCFAAENLQVLVPKRTAKVNVQEIDESKLLVSVLDPENNPIKGLSSADFVVKKGIKTAKILAAEMLETKRELGLNIVLVVDNSFSMKERQAVDPLLAALDEFLKMVRPIDHIEVVVFDRKGRVQAGDYALHLKTFQSNDAAKLRSFFKESFKERLCSETYLHEAMVGGIHLIKKMPQESNKFMVVFSDGEDLNSFVDKTVIEKEARGIKNFEAYAIDYMPAGTVDTFLKSFSETHGGRIWKAASAANLLPIFKSFSSTLLYRYIVEYRILNPPEGQVRLGAHELNFDILTTLDGSVLPYYVFFETGRSEIHPHYRLLGKQESVQSFDETKFKTILEKYRHILNLAGKRLKQNPGAAIEIIGCNSDLGIEKNNRDLSKNRAEAVQGYLNKIWGIEPSRMEITVRNLPAKPTATDLLGGRAENQRVEIVFKPAELQAAALQDFRGERNHLNQVDVLPQIKAEYGVANWDLTVEGKDQIIDTLQGTNELFKTYAVSLNKMSVQKLSNLEYIKASIKVTDINNDVLEASTQKHPVKVTAQKVVHEFILPPSGSVVLEPSAVTIEEVTTIDSSPLLNYIFFETGKSTLPERYILLKNREEAKVFNESLLRDTISKYNQVLNIIGKRLVENPDAGLKLVGCISDFGPEKGRIALSRGRIEAIRSYFSNIWGIDPARIQAEERKLPAAPSTNRLEEGRLENQRVEIYSDSPAVLDAIKSTYVAEISDATEIQVRPKIQIGYDLKNWGLEITADGQPLESFKGNGNNIPDYSVHLVKHGLKKIGSYKTLQAKITGLDEAGRTFSSVAANSSIKYLKREEQITQKTGFKVVEKYALILFDFDGTEIKERNKTVLDRVIKRIQELPNAEVTIAGHTDTIGKADYNKKLSERRAKAVYDKVMADNILSSNRILYMGEGSDQALFDNTTPEGRS